MDTVKTIFENEDLHCWHQNDGVAVVSFKTKMNTITDKVLEGLEKSIDIAEKNYQGLILWQQDSKDFSAGANLQLFMQAITDKGLSYASDFIANFQKTVLRLRYSTIPTIAAVRGRALGGGCELAIQCNRIVALSETYIGLVEVSVGLMPAAGGTKELALRATSKENGLNFNDLLTSFKQILRSEVSSSATDAQTKHYLMPTDQIIANPDHLLNAAKQELQIMIAKNFKLPLAAKFPVAGRQGFAKMQTELDNLLTMGSINEYDFYLGTKVANVICGGEIEMDTLVDEQYMLDLERETFVELLAQPQTKVRINHILQKGKSTKK
jgi:3-hydroxyacyl-CoA dehydrogenase